MSRTQLPWQHTVQTCPQSHGRRCTMASMKRCSARRRTSTRCGVQPSPALTPCLTPLVRPSRRTASTHRWLWSMMSRRPWTRHPAASLLWHTCAEHILMTQADGFSYHAEAVLLVPCCHRRMCLTSLSTSAATLSAVRCLCPSCGVAQEPVLVTHALELSAACRRGRADCLTRRGG